MTYSSTQVARPSYVHGLDQLKIIPFKKRLADGEWPMAFAHWIPFFGIYYAISRKTITPLLYSMGLGGVTGGIVGLIEHEATTAQDAAEAAAASLVLILITSALTPVVVRLGIRRIKQDARQRLIALGEIEGDIQKDQRHQQAQYSQPSAPQVTPADGFVTRFQENLRSRNIKQVSPQPQWQEPKPETAPQRPYTPLEDWRKDVPTQELPRAAVTTKEAPKPAIPVKSIPAQAITAQPVEVSESLEQKLLRLKQWTEQGLISEEEAKMLRQKELGLK